MSQVDKKIKHNNKEISKVESKKIKTVSKKSLEKSPEKESLWVRFRIFCHGVKSEFNKIHWLDKNNMVKYSLATIFLIIFFALFFYLINVIFALVQLLFK